MFNFNIPLINNIPDYKSIVLKIANLPKKNQKIKRTVIITNGSKPTTVAYYWNIEQKYKVK